MHPMQNTAPRRTVLAAVACLVLATACTEDAPPESELTPVPTSTATEQAEPASEPLQIELDLELRTGADSTFRLTGLEVADDRILVGVDFVLAADQSFVKLNASADPAVVVDDLGNEYPLLPPDDDQFLLIDGGQRLEGTLVYEGPLAADASTLQVLFNRQSDPEGNTVNDRIQPALAFPPIPLDGSSPAPDGTSAPTAVEEVQVELDLVEQDQFGSTFRVSGLEVTPTEILVDVLFRISPDLTFVQFDNSRDPAVLIDDLGNEYPLVAPSDNVVLMVEGGEELDGTLVYQGPLRPGATTLQVAFNRGSEPGGDTTRDRITPYAVFDEIPLDGS